MLICNLITEKYKQLKKEQFGLCTNRDMLYSLYNNQLGLDLGCTGVVVCYIPETCIGSTTTSCNIVLSQQISMSACDIVLVQTNDIP